MIREGGVFDGYHLLRLLGRGGAGEVYLAEPPAGSPLREQVALKIYRAARDEPVALELLRQARAVAEMRHPQILPCYADAAQGHDVGIVMAFASAGSLGDTLASRFPTIRLPVGPAVVARIITQVADALAAIHGDGLVHGDLKPTNVFMRPASDGSPIVAISDFGHAVLAGAALRELQENRFGQPPVWVTDQLTWVAPEQLRGRTVPASDQYSLAALAYFLLTGVRPISAEAQALISGGAARSIAPPSRLNPALDTEVDATLFNALAPLPHHRFGDIASFAEALNEALMARNAASRSAASLRLSGTLDEADAEDTAHRPTRRTLAHMGFVAPTPRPRRPSGSPMVLDDVDLPDEEGVLAAPRRRLTLGTTAALVLALFACVLGVLVVNPGGRLPLRLDLTRLVGANTAPTPQATSTPAGTAAQAQAQARLKTALASQPVYSDALTGTPAAWHVDGKSVFFGPDRHLHLHDTTKTALFADMPATATIPKGAYIAKVDVALAAGGASGHAGMRFLVSSSDKGATYYSYLVTAAGRFELWAQQPDTGLTFLTSGFVPALKSGAGQSNTLAVLVDPAANTLTLFANGTFVFDAPIRPGVAKTGRLGVVVPDNGVEATFANFALYNA